MISPVLVIDDEQNILNALRRAFSDEPYQLHLTTNQDEAFQILAKENVKVVLSDQRMPGLSGVDFLKQVCQRYPNTIRIIFTGFADVQTAEDAINKGEVYRFINKPWNDVELRTIVREAVRRHDLLLENKRLQELTWKQNTELVLANEQMQKMYEKEKQFTSTVSHELRTPLAAIKGAIDIVAGNQAGNINEKQSHFLGIAKRNVDRLNRLVDDVLSLTKLESGVETLNVTEVDLNELVLEMVRTQSPAAEKKGLYLRTELETGWCKIQADGDRLNQVLCNLINNAIKFTEQGGVVVSTKMAAGFASICVRDTGSGIEAASIPMLFQKFVQLDHSMERKVNGTGLGLAISKEIVGQHSGKIWVESEHGKGSAFFVALPLKVQSNGHQDGKAKRS